MGPSELPPLWKAILVLADAEEVEAEFDDA
jgi:hypothetical protein